LIGRGRVNVMDFEGAIEAFEQALEMNPQSAAAHFQLGWLYAEKHPDPAAAIYHYEKFLQRRPTAANAEMIRKHILGQKQKLAEAVLPMPPASGSQIQIEALSQENRHLLAELDRLRLELANRSGPTNPPPGRLAGGRAMTVAGSSLAARQPSPVDPARAGRGNSGDRTYKVMAGDTPAAIARRHGIKVESLLAANPSLNPKRMRVNQTLTIPGW